MAAIKGLKVASFEETEQHGQKCTKPTRRSKIVFDATSDGTHIVSSYTIRNRPMDAIMYHKDTNVFAHR